MENIDYYNCTDILCCVIYTFIVAICDAPVKTRTGIGVFIHTFVYYYPLKNTYSKTL